MSASPRRRARRRSMSSRTSTTSRVGLPRRGPSCNKSWTATPPAPHQILDRDSTSARAHNNLAVSWAAEGDFEHAGPRLETALSADPQDPGLWLNLGLLQYAIGDTSAALAPIAQGISLSGGYEQACGLLGVSTSEIAG